MMDQPANENRTRLRQGFGGQALDRARPVLSVVPKRRAAPTASQLQTLAELAAKAAEVRAILGLPPGAPIPAGPLTWALIQSRTR